MKKLIVITAGLVLALAAIAMGIQVGPPGLTNVQGRLLDGFGNPVVDGNYNMIFSVWDRAVGGSQLWAETLSVPVSGGLFSAVLGQVHSVDPDWLKSVDPDFAPHLQTAVNGEALSTRTRIVSNPYSGQASRVTGDIETGPGELVFIPVSPPELPEGIIFKNSTGDTVAQYGPGAIVIKDVSSADEVQIDFTKFVFNELGQTVAQYGPGGAVWVQPQPEPPLPAAAKIGSFGLVLGDVGPNHIRYGPSGIVMTDASGDTTFRVQKSTLDIAEIQLSDNTSDGRIRAAEIVFTTAGDTAVRFSPSGLAFGDVGPNHIRYGPSGIFMTNATADTEVYITPDFVRICDPMRFTEDGAILMLDASGDTNVQISNSIFRVCEPMVSDTNAGASQAVQVGQRWRDNAIVAWGRVTSAGILTNDYGVASAVRNSTGNYTITLDASASLPGNLITTANAELDAAPTTAGASRLIYVDQAAPGGVSVNSFNIYITNGSFAAADNDFMFMVTAR